MNRMRSLATAALFVFALTMAAQPATIDVPAVADQLKALTGRLDLSADQQTKLKPILQELHDATLKIVRNKSLSHDERLAKVRPWRYAAAKKMREILNDDQKKKLEQYLAGPHPEVHGDLTGTPSVPPQAKPMP